MLAPSRLRLTLLPCALMLASLAACSGLSATRGLLGFISPYRIDRVQGNVVTREQVAELKVGMPRQAVKEILGTPLLQSVFHADRWDYVFSFARLGAESQLRHVTVYFKGDVLERFEADSLPSESEFVATLHTSPPSNQPPAMEASPESLQKFPPPAKPAPLPPPAARATTDYPPLEPAAR
ncbi:MAG: outer membrane protein assembly factor BamE [Rhodoferax sp.]|nr:outer membrane protein assembly factor BamE [Rhodoferax sp.]